MSESKDMTPASDVLDPVIADLSERAKKIVDDGHSIGEIMRSLIADFVAIGSAAGAVDIMTSGKLQGRTRESAERIAVKIIASLGLTQ